MLERGLFVLTGVVALLTCLGCSGGDDESSGDDDASGQGNVDFAASCSLREACGGDPIGRWNVVRVCMQPNASDFDCNWELTAWGEMSGTVEISSGSYSLDTDAELHHCDGASGSGRVAGGESTIMGSTLVLGTGTRTLSFCVDGNTLWLSEMGATSPDFSVLELARADAI